MGHKGLLIVGFIVSAGLVGCINSATLSQAEPTVPLNGEAYLGAPLDQAKISVETAAGDPVELASAGTTSQGRFFEKLSPAFPLSELTSHLPLTVKVTGGTLDGKPFDGTLLGYTSSFAPGDHLHVNILTTLIVKYHQSAGVTLAQAERAVNSSLGVPADVDLASKLNNPNYWHHLNPTRFMAQAQTQGGFDALSDQVVTSIASSQQVGAALVGGEEGGSIASKAASWLLDSTGEGLVAWGVDQGMGWILSACGYQNPTEKALSEIQTQLTQVNATLTTIQSDINTLTNQMTQLLALVQLSWDSLTSTMSSLNMSSAEDIIQNQSNNMLSTFNAAYANFCTPAGNAAAASFAQDIQSAQAYDIDQQIYSMYANITGKNPGSNGGVSDLAAKLVDQIKGGQDPYDAYIALENYFGELAGIQAQGLNLMIEAIHQPLIPTDGSGVTTFQGTATDYYNKFYGQMSDEVEVYLACVDRLVVAAVDVRSEIAQKFAYLSPETAAIYSRADFVASQLSSKQPSGLIVRLIGDPNSVSDWTTNNKIQAAGNNFTVVAVNGVNINSYSATIPTTTPGAAHYLTWTVNNNVYTFQTETNVSVVKLQVTATGAGSFAVTCPDTTQNQTLNVDLYNNDFQPASASDTPQVAFGSGVLYVRMLPTWQAGTATKTEDTHNQWGTTFTPNPAEVSVSLHSYPEQLDWWLSCPLTYTGQILSTIANGGASSLTVTLNWNGTQNTTYEEWTPSGSASTNGGSQYLICQTTTQQSTGNGQAMSLKSVSLAPNASTAIYYRAEQQVHSGNVIYGDDLTTNAFLTSMEIVPTQ